MVIVVNCVVALSLCPNPAGLSPGTPTQLTVTNTGAAPGTFNLTMAGPAASLITLPVASVTLAAGASQMLSVGIGNPTFATAGSLAFSIAAQSTSQPIAAASVSGSIYCPVRSRCHGCISTGIANGSPRAEPRCFP